MPGVTGFADAPCTKAALFFTWVTSMITHVLRRQDRLVLDVAKTARGQLWRLWTCHLVWRGVGQAVVGSLLLYHFRIIERQMGSKKFGTLVAVGGTLSSLVLLGVGMASPGFEPEAGPIPIVFALLVLYFVCVPVLQPRLLGVLSVNFTDKSLAYALALQLALCEGAASAAPAAVGLLVGCAYRLNFLKLQRAHMPGAVYRICSKLHPCFRSARRATTGGAAARQPSRRWARPEQTPPRQRAPGPLLPTIAGFGGGATTRSRAAVRQQQQQATLSPRTAGLVPDAAEEAAAVRVLVGMGFRQTDAVAALRATGGNNIEVAANRLLAAAAAAGGGGAPAAGVGTDGAGGDPDHSHAH